jgi:hypothetical protein
VTASSTAAREASAPPRALTILSELVAAADGPVPPSRALPVLRDLADELGDSPEDAFGFGMVAYHALTGRDPFPEPGAPARPVTDALPGFPPFAAEVVMRAIGPNADRRPSPAALITVLEVQPRTTWPTADPAAGRPSERVVPREEVRRAARAIVAPSIDVPRIEPLDPDAAVPVATSNPNGPNRVRPEGTLRKLLGR